MKEIATFELELQYWDQGISLIAGVDEVGMGALAGPVVAGAVVFERWVELPGMHDSKQLTAKRREDMVGMIKREALAWAIGEASVEEITELNIRGASHLAMRRAVDQLAVRPTLLLIDGTPAPSLRQGFGGHGNLKEKSPIPIEFIVRGDALSVSIAAASIMAKVYRDELMRRLDVLFPAYGFASHKGYGSTAHKAALVEHGATPHHRPTYAPVAALHQTRGLDRLARSG